MVLAAIQYSDLFLGRFFDKEPESPGTKVLYIEDPLWVFPDHLETLMVFSYLFLIATMWFDVKAYFYFQKNKENFSRARENFYWFEFKNFYVYCGNLQTIQFILKGKNWEISGHLGRFLPEILA